MLNNFATFDPQTSLLGLPKAISVALQCLNFVAMLLYTEKNWSRVEPSSRSLLSAKIMHRPTFRDEIDHSN